MTPALRWRRFLEDVVLAKVSGPIVLFVDEIDAAISLEFGSDFFAAVRAMYNGRERSDLSRLTFCLLGVALPSELIDDPTKTPFNVGTEVELYDFTYKELAGALAGIDQWAGHEAAIREIYEQTSGHPQMTAELCLRYSERRGAVSKLVQTHFIDGNPTGPIAFAEAWIRRPRSGKQTRRLLDIYARVLAGERVIFEGSRPDLRALLLTGLVGTRTTAAGKVVAIRNEIFRAWFGESWILEVRRNLSLSIPDSGRQPSRKNLLYATLAVAILSGTFWQVSEKIAEDREKLAGGEHSLRSLQESIESRAKLVRRMTVLFKLTDSRSRSERGSPREVVLVLEELALRCPAARSASNEQQECLAPRALIEIAASRMGLDLDGEERGAEAARTVIKAGCERGFYLTKETWDNYVGEEYTVDYIPLCRDSQAKEAP